jgi:hypothetical protein
MATNAQRHGTRNLPVNLPEEYLRELGRAAFERFDNCRSKLVVTFIEAGAAQHDPALAARLREIRLQFYGVRAARATILLAIFCATMFAHSDLLRSGRRHQRQDENQVEVMS